MKKNKRNTLLLGGCVSMLLIIGAFVGLKGNASIKESLNEFSAQLSASANVTNFPNIGFSYFKSYSELETTGDYARTPITWSVFQPLLEAGILWDNGESRQIKRLQVSGKKVIPVIRSVGAGTRNGQVSSICSSAPKDLEKKWNPNYGHSKSFYGFVKEIALKHKGQFPIVAVENEMHDTKFWCADSSMDDYILVFKTVKKAFRDNDSSVLVTDGGVQGGTIGLMALEDLVLSGRELAAIDFYTRLTGKVVSSIDEVKKDLEWYKAGLFVSNAWYLVNTAKLYSYVDRINFHHYQSSDTLTQDITFLKKIGRGKPLLTNEIGRFLEKSRYPDEKERISEGAKEMVRKIAILTYFKVKPIIWYSGAANMEYRNASAFFEMLSGVIDTTRDWEDIFEGIRVSKTINTYRAVVKFLNRAPLSVKTEAPHDGKMIFRYMFEYPDESVAVTWMKDGPKGSAVTTNPSCRVYLYSGQEATTDRDKQISVDPLYVVCPR